MTEPTTQDPPREPRTAEGITVNLPPAPPAPPQQVDVEALRRQWEQEQEAREQRIREEYNGRLAPLEQARREQEEAAAAAQHEREEAERRAREEQESAADRYARQQEELRAEIAAVRNEAEQNRSLLAREREYNELQEYRRQAIAQAADRIHPTYVRFVKGFTREEIDQSIAEAAGASEELLADIEAANGAAAAAQQQYRQQMPGVTPTAPAAGPLEMAGSTRTLTPEQIRAMPMHEYAQYREQLGVTGSGRQDAGIFG